MALPRNVNAIFHDYMRRASVPPSGVFRIATDYAPYLKEHFLGKPNSTLPENARILEISWLPKIRLFPLPHRQFRLSDPRPRDQGDRLDRCAGGCTIIKAWSARAGR